jgi:hypothetical protein
MGSVKLTDDELRRMEQEFSDSQQAMIDAFKKKMASISEDVLGSIYTDCSQFAVDDAHVNYRNYLREYFKESLINEVTDQYSYHSWAHGIRLELLKQYPEKISNKIILDLQDKVKALEEHIQQLRSFR